MRIVFKFLFLAMIGLISFSIVGCGNIKEIGSDKYYVQILKDGDEKTEFFDNMGKVAFYEYNNIDAYNKKGKKIQVSFEASKNLRKGAFLEVRVRNPKFEESNSILSYKEVKENELPKLVKEKLNINN